MTLIFYLYTSGVYLTTHCLIPQIIANDDTAYKCTC